TRAVPEEDVRHAGVAVAGAIDGHAPAPALLVRVRDLHRRVAGAVVLAAQLGDRIEAGLLEPVGADVPAAGALVVRHGPPVAAGCAGLRIVSIGLFEADVRLAERLDE